MSTQSNRAAAARLPGEPPSTGRRPQRVRSVKVGSTFAFSGFRTTRVEFRVYQMPVREIHAFCVRITHRFDDDSGLVALAAGRRHIDKTLQATLAYTPRMSPGDHLVPTRRWISRRGTIRKQIRVSDVEVLTGHVDQLSFSFAAQPCFIRPSK